MWMGQYQAGQFALVAMRALDTSGAPVWPEEAPGMMVLRCTDNTVVSTRKIALFERSVVGYFQDRIQLDATFTVGGYDVLFTYKVAGAQRMQQCRFEVVAGGDPDGAIIAAYFVRSDQQSHVIIQTDTGICARHKNPRLY